MRCQTVLQSCLKIYFVSSFFSFITYVTLEFNDPQIRCYPGEGFPPLGLWRVNTYGQCLVDRFKLITNESEV